MVVGVGAVGGGGPDPPSQDLWGGGGGGDIPPLIFTNTKVHVAVSSISF